MNGGRKRVYIIHTGGTVGMKPSPEGYIVAPGSLGQQLAGMRELSDPSMPEYVLYEYEPLLDSSNMVPDDWLAIAREIAGNYEAYDGFVILHGTDTMAYTASALAFMLEGLEKPVIVSGSQLPLCEVRNDARENIITSLLIAANCSIPEVCLFFGSKLLRGCRAVKVSAGALDAFDSPNFPPLGVAGTDIEIRWSLVRNPPEPGSLAVQVLRRPSVGALRLFPGIRAETVRNVLQPPIQGLVLEAYGVGNGPDRDRAFLAALEDAVARGVVIVDCTQCLAGMVSLGDYATGSALARAGVVSGYDMTAEAALTKLIYLFSKDYEPEQVKAAMAQNLRGELTPPA